MKECVDNYIILRDGCYPDGTVPTSGFYLESVEGMSVENVASITPEKLQTATALVIDKLVMAATIVETRLRGLLAARGLELNTIGKLQTACLVSTTSDTAFATDKGVIVSQEWLASDAAAIFVETVKFKSAIAGDTTIKVSDLSGNVLWSKTVTALAGYEHNVAVRKSFHELAVRVTVDSTNIEPYRYLCDGSTNCTPCMQTAKYLKIEGWNGSGISSVGWVGVCARLNCTDVDIICQYLDRKGIALAILYQLAAEVAKEWVSPSNRLNIFKTHGEEWAITKQKDWEGMSIDYLNLDIDAIIQIMKTDTYCYNCKGRIVGKPMIP